MEQEILHSWEQNAEAWVGAVRAGAISSRQLVTDSAVLQAIVDCAPASVLDIGCGEGWLMRALQRHNIAASGIDGQPSLVRAAQLDGLQASLLSYQELLEQGPPQSAAMMVANFSLLGCESSGQVVAAAQRWLPAGGWLLIQTLHPLQVCGDLPYEDGWREGSWEGCGEGFVSPAPWYFRTLESWLALLQRHGLSLQKLMEPLHPQTRRPASLLLLARQQGRVQA
ncbi:methyltransferase domain-containing protein [Pseudomaricurvus sp. HS19]|nr:methyltransferase domain-containing protein [Pseudomaricurvus sp. HS19]